MWSTFKYELIIKTFGLGKFLLIWTATFGCHLSKGVFALCQICGYYISHYVKFVVQANSKRVN